MLAEPLPPSDLAEKPEDATPNSYTVKWTYPFDQSTVIAFFVERRELDPDGVPVESWVPEEHAADATQAADILSGDVAGKTFEVRVRAAAGPNKDKFSDYSDPVTVKLSEFRMRFASERNIEQKQNSQDFSSVLSYLHFTESSATLVCVVILICGISKEQPQNNVVAPHPVLCEGSPGWANRALRHKFWHHSCAASGSGWAALERELRSLCVSIYLHSGKEVLSLARELWLSLHRPVQGTGLESSFSFSKLCQSSSPRYSAYHQKLELPRGKMQYLPHDT